MLDDDTVLDNGTTEMTTNENVENEMTENQVEDEEKGGKMAFDELAITGESDSDIMDK